MKQRSQVQPFESVADLKAFFVECDRLQPDGTEPDWEQHLVVMDEARKRGATST